VLLAPFEGRLSEIGYNAYYAVLLALHEANAHHMELLAIDDGGSITTAIERAHAIADDPLVTAVLALGESASNTGVQQTLDDIPMIVIGQWGTEPTIDSTFILASPPNTLRADGTILSISDLFAALDDDIPLSGGDALALEQFRLRIDDVNTLQVTSNSTPADDVFRERYAVMGLFTPEPNLLATLVYDAAHMAILAAQSANSTTALSTMRHQGINGTLQFRDGYWLNPPLYTYQLNADSQWVEVSAS
jgi:ABC-type branched-subunit amino acid transport system substrate-binding protein